MYASLRTKHHVVLSLIFIVNFIIVYYSLYLLFINIRIYYETFNLIIF